MVNLVFTPQTQLPPPSTGCVPPRFAVGQLAFLRRLPRPRLHTPTHTHTLILADFGQLVQVCATPVASLSPSHGRIPAVGVPSVMVQYFCCDDSTPYAGHRLHCPSGGGAWCPNKTS
jgi:hypothetical protein